jgi:hypothetical protein
MITASTIISWVLAGAPVSPTTEPEFKAAEIQRVEFERSDDSVQITTRGSDGEVSAEVFLWTDRDGRVRFDAAWPDGLYLSVVTDGEDATVDTENAGEVASRIERLDAALQETQESWWTCGAGVALTGFACAGAAAIPNPWTVGACGGTLYVTFCDCAHTAKQEFECY